MEPQVPPVYPTAATQPAPAAQGQAQQFTQQTSPFSQVIANLQINKQMNKDPDNKYLLDITSGKMFEYDDGKYYFIHPITYQKTLVEESNANEYCYGTYLTDINQPEQCKKLTDILSKMGGKFDDVNFGLFMQIINSNDIDKFSTTYVVHPELITLILENLGFEQITVQKLGKKLREFESVNSWRRRLLDPSKSVNYNDVDYKPIFRYLEKLVTYINNNPSILNHDTKGLNKQEPSINIHGHSFNYVDDQPITMQVDQHQNSLGIANYVTTMRSLRSPMERLFVPVVGGSSVMSGGGQHAKKIKTMINNIVSVLNQKGKTLKKADADNINAFIDHLDRLEDQVERIEETLSQYNDWTSTVPDGQKETLNFQQIEEKISEYRKCIDTFASAENGLVNVYAALCKNAK